MATGLSSLYARRAKEVQASSIREICKLISNSKICSMAGGWPDPKTFPAEEIREIATRVLTDYPEMALQYGASEGIPALCEELARWTASRDGISCTPDQVFVTSGSAQGMELVAKVLIEPGDVAFVGLPTYFGGTGACRTFGAELVGVPLDDDGMNPEALEARIDGARSAGKKPKLIYIIPDFQNPTGATLPVERRKRIVDLANEYDLAIVEDNPYRNLCFTGKPLPPLKAFDTEGRIVCLRSFSKIFCPGFRLAFAIGEKDMIRRMVISRQFEDCCSNVFAQYILLEFIKEGLLDDQIEKNCRYYKKKRDVLLESLDRHFPKSVKWNRPAGGFFVFVHLPDTMDSEELLRHAVDRNVAFVAGTPFYIDNRGRNTFRLSYAQADEEAMKEAVAVLGRLIEERTQQESGERR
ncbi:MAG: PLP-dependent aminotransferase family protein [bacterium]|nr:MAG: PLP-dependent aminotransferase family protein [bacterium]